MSNGKVHILTPNKNSSRFFGVDFFASLCTGSNPTFKYYSTSIDFNAVFKNEILSFSDLKLETLAEELADKEPNQIIGLTQNPDIYSAIDSIEPILKILDEYDMGLYLESNSQKIIEDLEILGEFAKKHPLLVAVPVAGDNDFGNEPLFPENSLLDNVSRILNKLMGSGIKYGVLLKPVIPLMNDAIEPFKKMVKSVINSGAMFVYPSFALHFDSAKLKAFYDVIDKYNPELKFHLEDEYGRKNAWSSLNTSQLKKEFVIICRKQKALFSMKDIINLYKPDENVQMKLF